MNKIALGICLFLAACNTPTTKEMRTLGKIERIDPPSTLLPTLPPNQKSLPKVSTGPRVRFG